jgi:toxin-antitoxin system PIN domain toxin
MRCVDVNVLVYAHRPESPEHERHRAWLDRARSGPERLGLPDVAASGFVRVVTHPRIFREPTPIDVALAFVDALRESPATVSLQPGDRHWAIFSDLCRRVGAAGNLVPDAYLAALAVENGATFVTADRGFTRFPDVEVAHPLDE